MVEEGRLGAHRKRSFFWKWQKVEEFSGDEDDGLPQARGPPTACKPRASDLVGAMLSSDALVPSRRRDRGTGGRKTSARGREMGRFFQGEKLMCRRRICVRALSLSLSTETRRTPNATSTEGVKESSRQVRRKRRTRQRKRRGFRGARDDSFVLEKPSLALSTKCGGSEEPRQSLSYYLPPFPRSPSSPPPAPCPPLATATAAAAPPAFPQKIVHTKYTQMRKFYKREKKANSAQRKPTRLGRGKQQLPPHLLRRAVRRQLEEVHARRRRGQPQALLLLVLS